MDYKVVRSGRRSIAVEVKSDLSVVVRAPLRMRDADVRRFVESRSPWIEKHLEIAKKRLAEQGPRLTKEEIAALAAAAAADIPPRIREYAQKIGAAAGKITVRSQKKRWGSCSSKGNLSFNCLLMSCPPYVRDYVIVHELCHLKELNHSPRFWAEVARVMPDYKEREKWLKQNGSAIIGRER